MIVAKFKIGDRVIPVRSSATGRYVEGKEYVVKNVSGNLVYTEVDSSGSTTNAWHEENFELITPQGPVRTKTVKEIVPGVYGSINIENVYRDGVNIYANPGKWSVSDLRAAALVLTQLAEALEE